MAMIGLGLDPVEEVLAELGITRKKYMRDPFKVCQMFGHARQAMMEADRRERGRDRTQFQPCRVSALEKCPDCGRRQPGMLLQWMRIERVRNICVPPIARKPQK